MFRFTALAVASAAAFVSLFACATTAHAEGLPPCPASGDQPAECLLGIENPGFDGEGALVNWMRNLFRPDTVHIEDQGNPMLALAPGGSVSQVVHLPVASGAASDIPYLVPSLFVRSEGGEGKVEISVQLVDDHGSYEAFSHTYTAGAAWTHPSGGFDAGRRRGHASAMVIQIARKDSQAGVTLYVDDVQVIKQR